MSKTIFPPPEFSGKSYEAWCRELKLWRTLTDLDKKKQAPAIALSLKGKYREVAMSLTDDEMTAESGFDNLLTKLDQKFKKDKVDLAYEAYNNFERYRRSQSTSIVEFVNEFESRYDEMAKYDMKYPKRLRGVSF